MYKVKVAVIVNYISGHDGKLVIASVQDVGGSCGQER